MTFNQLQVALQDAAGRALQEGKLSRQTIEQSLAANTALQRQDVRQIAGEIEQQLGQTVEEVQTAAAQVAEQTGQALWGLFFVLLLGLVGALLGALLGTSRPQRALAA